MSANQTPQLSAAPRDWKREETATAVATRTAGVFERWSWNPGADPLLHCIGTTRNMARAFAAQQIPADEIRAVVMARASALCKAEPPEVADVFLGVVGRVLDQEIAHAQKNNALIAGPKK